MREGLQEPGCGIGYSCMEDVKNLPLFDTKPSMDFSEIVSCSY